jgi:hypothetical protein
MEHKEQSDSLLNGDEKERSLASGDTGKAKKGLFARLGDSALFGWMGAALSVLLLIGYLHATTYVDARFLIALISIPVLMVRKRKGSFASYVVLAVICLAAIIIIVRWLTGQSPPMIGQ